MRNFLLKILPYGLRIEVGRIKRYIKYAYHLNINKRGKLKQCPICSKEIAFFLPAGEKRRAIHCPFCSSFPRHRAMWLYLQNNDLLQSGIKILHVSPEPSMFNIMSKMQNYTAIDKFASGYAYPKSVLQMDVEQLEFDNDCFDLIICSHVLEHVDDDIAAIKEMGRVVKKDGKILIMIPIEKDLEVTFEDKSIISPKERLKHFGQSDHVRLYGMDFAKRIEQTELNCEMISTREFVNESDYIKYGIDDDFIFVLTRNKNVTIVP
jgi:SAM-dependent methyltransferase